MTMDPRSTLSCGPNGRCANGGGERQLVAGANPQGRYRGWPAVAVVSGVVDPLNVGPDFDEAAELCPVTRLQDVLAAVVQLPVTQQKPLSARRQIHLMVMGKTVEQERHREHIRPPAPPGP